MEATTMGGKPSKGTPADRRLKANAPAPTVKPAAGRMPAAPRQGKQSKSRRG